jgi:hypothetical protein
VDIAAAALVTDASKLLADKDVEELQWRNLSYVTKEDAFEHDKFKRPTRRIFLKLRRGKDGFELDRKNV